VSRLAGSPLGQELLDDPSADSGAVRLSLRNIARANRYFGGWWAVRTGLAHLLGGHTAPALSLLDVGTGAGDLLLRARDWSLRGRSSVRMLGIDQHPEAARLAHASGIPAVIGCGATLPLRDGAVDVVILSQVAHHLAPASLAAMARETSRVSRIGVVLADLRPSRLAGAAYRLTGPFLGFDRHTVVDGITSLRRGFTRTRLAHELGSAGIQPWIATRGVRIVAAWRTDGGAA